MCDSTELQEILAAFVRGCRGLFGDKLRDVRLFGSYARGDMREDSDIDVMVILDMDSGEARRQLFAVCGVAFEADLGRDTIISPIVRSQSDYDRYRVFPGLYYNVMKEGVILAPDKKPSK